MNWKQLENPSAFPGFESPAGGLPGMSLRDYFAAKAMQGLAEDTVLTFGTKGERFSEELAAVAYRIADAMLKARQA